MTEVIRTLSSLSILLFAVSSMLSAGCSFTVRDVLGPLREPNRIARALIGNFVLAPLLAVVIARVFSLNPGLTLGLVLLGSAAGAPFLIKLISTAEGDVAMGTSLLVLLVPMTVVFMPFIVPLLVPEAAVSAASIAVPLALTMLLPLGVGLFLSEVATKWARALAPVARKTSTITLMLVIATTLVLNASDLRGIVASSASLAIVVFVLGSFAIGYLIASPHSERRAVLGLGTAQRNVAAATIVAAENARVPESLDLGHADALVLVVITGVLELLVLFPVARWLRGHQRNDAAIHPPSGLAGSRA
jgi:BASS family bile acid:Na+ symporter